MSICSLIEAEDITKRKSATARVGVRTGRVQLNTLGKDTTHCPMNLKYFPFDKHTCAIEFMHTSRYGLNINNSHFEREGIIFQTDDLPSTHLLLKSGEWDLMSFKLDTTPRVENFTGTIITYPMFTVILELHRKPSFYVVVLMLPSILISWISVIGFLLPSESGEKVSLQLTALLSYTLVLLLIVDIIPPAGGNLPLIGNIAFDE